MEYEQKSVSDGYLYLNRKKRPKYQKKTMQTRPKKCNDKRWRLNRDLEWRN